MKGKEIKAPENIFLDIYTKKLITSGKWRFLVRFVNDFLSFGILCGLFFFVVDYNFIFFARTRLIKCLYLIFAQIYSSILAFRTTTNWRTHTIHFFTPTVITITLFCTVTTIFIYFESVNHYGFLFKSFFIYRFCFIYHKIPCFRIVFSIETVSTST